MAEQFRQDLDVQVIKVYSVNQINDIKVVKAYTNGVQGPQGPMGLNADSSSFIQNSQTASMLYPYVLTSSTSSMLSPYLLISQASSSSIDTSSFAIKTNITGAFNSISQSFDGRITTIENTTLLSSVTSSIVFNSSTSSFANKTEISGAFNATSSSFGSRITITENFITGSFIRPSDTGSFALSTNITGAFTSLSSSITSRITTVENITIDTSSFVVNSQTSSFVTNSQTSSFALKTNISGAFNQLSQSITSGYLPLTGGIITGNVTVMGTASIALLYTMYNTSSVIYQSGSTKFGDTMDDNHSYTGSLNVTGSSFVWNNWTVVTSNDTSSYAMKTNISGAFTTVSSSFASRITTNESTITDILTSTSSFALKTSVSGAFTVASGGLASRITTVENTQADILTATSSYALKANISGSITAFSSSATTRITTLENAGYITSAQSGGFATTGSNTFTGTQTITNMTLATNGQILLTVPTVNSQSTGFTTNAFNLGYATSSVGDLVYLDVNSTWQKTDANITALYNGLLGISLAVTTSGSSLLVALPGSIVFCNAFPTFTVGSPIYMSETAGVVTQTQPTTTDAAIRVLGWAIHANKMYFNPSQDYATHT